MSSSVCTLCTKVKADAGRPRYTYTAVPKIACMEADLAKTGAANPATCCTIPLQARVGMLSSKVIQNRSRNIATL